MKRATKVRRVAIFAMASLLGLEAGATDARSGAPLLARAAAFDGWTYGWTIAVSTQGEVHIEREAGGGRPQRFTLAEGELRAFTRKLEAERPWELPSEIGQAVIEGPERLLEIAVAGRSARFVVRSTPAGVSRASLAQGGTELARAVRLCEAIRALADDTHLRPCIDGQ